jgi:hypothetical protein
MNLHFSDGKYACMAASALLGIAAFIVFGIHPGGFEGQIGLFFALLPGAIAGAFISDRIFHQTPFASAIAAWSAIIGISFLWYFAMSYAVIKAFRLGFRLFKHD